jgi:hypothetical protein
MVIKVALLSPHVGFNLLSTRDSVQPQSQVPFQPQRTNCEVHPTQVKYRPNTSVLPKQTETEGVERESYPCNMPRRPTGL